MPNHYFQFKQFRVEQEHCAMKVCTDSCLFGAWMANYLQKRSGKNDKLLDVGTGTGLLVLMLAQKVKADIDAVEIEQAAFQQANQNFAASPWQQRLKAYHNNIIDFDNDKAYNSIISNPPFYENDLKSSFINKNQAMHATDLNYTNLITSVNRLLATDGQLGLLLPYKNFDVFCEKAEAASLHLQQRIDVRQSINHGFFRTIGIFSRKKAAPIISEISIRDNNNEYTSEFKTLLSDYYLHL